MVIFGSRDVFTRKWCLGASASYGLYVALRLFKVAFQGCSVQGLSDSLCLGLCFFVPRPFKRIGFVHGPCKELYMTYWVWRLPRRYYRRC